MLSFIKFRLVGGCFIIPNSTHQSSSVVSYFSTLLHSTSFFASCRSLSTPGIFAQVCDRSFWPPASDCLLISHTFCPLRGRSQVEVRNYVRSITTIPEAVQPEAESWLWRMLPVSKAAKDTLQRMTDLSLVRDPLFLVPALANLLASVGLFVPFVYITKRATDIGVEASDAAWLLSTIGTSAVFFLAEIMNLLRRDCLASKACIRSPEVEKRTTA